MQFRFALFFLFLSSLLGSCKNEDYVINGHFCANAKKLCPYVYVVSYNNKYPDGIVVDSVFVKDGNFQIKGTLSDTLKFVKIQCQNFRVPVILEAGTIDVDMMDLASHGTPLNEKLYVFGTQLDSIMKVAQNTVVTLEQKLNSGQIKDEEFESEYLDAAQIMFRNKRELALATYKDNLDNIIGGIAFKVFLQGLPNRQEFECYLPDLKKEVLNSREVKEYFNFLDARDRTDIGRQFVEVKGLDYEGKEIALSDHVAKGKYTVVDFWAGWCSPCHKFVSVMKDLQKKYGEERLSVVGIAVWDDPENIRTAIKNYKTSCWPQIINKKANDIYAIRRIPYVMLLDPNGKIIGRGLKDKDLKEQLKRIFEKRE